LRKTTPVPTSTTKLFGLAPGKGVFRQVPNPPLDIDDLRTNIQSLGRQIGRLEGQGGLQEGARKRLFKAFWDDLEAIPGGTRAGKAVATFRAAREASKREFAVDTYTQIIEGAFSPIKGQGDRMFFNAAEALKKIRALINPKHAQYDKNFADALGGSVNFKKSLELLEEANKFPSSGFGPAGLIIAGKFAAIGGFVARMLGLPPEIGAIMAVQLPERLTEFLLSPGGRKTLTRVMRMGKGIINDRAINVGAQAARKFIAEPEIPIQTIQAMGGLLDRFRN